MGTENYIIRDSADEYIPEEHGAQCERCPLRDTRDYNKYVPIERGINPLITVVAEAPGRNEEEMRRPLIGPSGQEHASAMLACGIKREQTNLTNVLLCRPPGNKLKALLHVTKLRNQRRKEQDRELLLSPLEACKPRLLNDLADSEALLLLGGISRGALYNETSDKGLARARGFPDVVEVQGKKVQTLSTLHPAFVLREPRWRRFYRADCAKAIRMARKELSWTVPEYVFFPKPDELRHALYRMEGKIVSYDVETRPKYWQYGTPEATTDVLRCIGIGTSDLCVCVPFESCETARIDQGWRAFYTSKEYDEIIAILRAWFTSYKPLCAHNEQYDHLVMRHQLPEVPVKRRIFDTVLAHHVAFSEYPHDLGFLESQYTDNIQHKAVKHDAWDSDSHLHRYCMDDVAVTSYAASQLCQEPAFQEQRKVFAVDMWLSKLCREMHDAGIGFDTEARDRHFSEQSEIMDRMLLEFREWAEKSLEVFGRESLSAVAFIRELNPASPAQLRQFLFDLCGILPVEERDGGQTETGEHSVSRDNLLFLIDRGLPPELEEAIQCLIGYREALKLRGTYCTIEPMEDGRVRSSWNPHVVVSGRLSSSRPNLMNVKGPMRSMFCSTPGNLMVFCDKAQLELRIIAWLAQDTQLIDAFLAGKDVHKVNTAGILGIDDPEEVTKAQRKFGKTYTYAVQYGAAAEKAWKMVRNYREPDGSRPFRAFTLAQSEAAHAAWWAARRAIARYHERNRASWRKTGYIDEPIHGRRRYFADGEDKEAMSNFPIQSCAAADVNNAMMRIEQTFPFGGEVKLVHYNYDSVGLEVPESRALEVGAKVVKIMESKLGDMPLPVDLAIGPNWYDLTEYKQDELGIWREVEE